MSILVFTENWDGAFRKSSFEAVSYAFSIAQKKSTNVVAVSVGEVNNEELKKLALYGASTIISCSQLNKGSSKAVAQKISSLSNDCSIIIFSNSYASKAIAPRVSAKIKAGYVNNVIDLPVSLSPNIEVKRNSFSLKAIEQTKITTEKGIISIAPNSYQIIENNIDCTIKIDDVNESDTITVDRREMSKGKISLSEAEIVVSAGRGLKGPENWNMIEELADNLNAATACSKPVSDIGWRPHSEHVGQTGKAVSPNLYIAIGISGAIQHLAGVSGSKVMVVINTDAEAPFFKAADYGIVGDAFKVVPKLIEEIKNLRD
tara:strand:- start:1566 stop:2516 length:951 start_codon:yes stop_codon:yes gene_type:complete